jgi:Putative transposase
MLLSAKLKTPWRGGTTHLVMSPMEFVQRLAALVPQPKLHLIRFHGVLAPNAKLRALVVPQAPATPTSGFHGSLGRSWPVFGQVSCPMEGSQTSYAHNSCAPQCSQ